VGLIDLRWADGVAISTPMKMPLHSPQLEQFVDVVGGVWFRRELQGRLYASFTATGLDHEGVYASTVAAGSPVASAQDVGSHVAQMAALVASQQRGGERGR
jgi:multimeric flavodoxin WrbA